MSDINNHLIYVFDKEGLSIPVTPVKPVEDVTCTCQGCYNSFENKEVMIVDGVGPFCLRCLHNIAQIVFDGYQNNERTLFLIDASGSMRNEYFDEIPRVIKMFLKEKDEVYSFSSGVEKIDDLDTFQFRPGGSDLSQTYQIASEFDKIVVFTDGLLYPIIDEEKDFSNWTFLYIEAERNHSFNQTDYEAHNLTNNWVEESINILSEILG